MARIGRYVVAGVRCLNHVCRSSLTSTLPMELCMHNCGSISGTVQLLLHLGRQLERAAWTEPTIVFGDVAGVRNFRGAKELLVGSETYEKYWNM